MVTSGLFESYERRTAVRKYRKWSSAASRNVRLAGQRVLATLDRNEVLGLLKEGLHDLAVEVGRLVAVGLLEDEVNQLCGKRHTYDLPGRKATRHGGQRGWAVVAGQKVPIARPRVRHTGDQGQSPYFRSRVGARPGRVECGVTAVLVRS
jgi:hypothetical protein